MHKQDKTTTERHTKVLRELVKKPENKLCADCKRNDPRWASWNLGVFICIRCSGIHRSMGTHISKVKSVDLDTWTPEQMDSIQKWGNHRANLYWEAHLKAGHVPPDHKIESFIRSKYESRRWALEGLPPTDPGVLDNSQSNGGSFAPSPSSHPPPPPTTQRSHVPTGYITQQAKQPATHQLLSVSNTSRTTPIQQATKSQSSAPVASPSKEEPVNDLFSLDFNAPPPSALSKRMEAQPKKDLKQDILSLYSSAPKQASTNIGYGNAPIAQDSFAVWGQPQPPSNTSTPAVFGNASGTPSWTSQPGWNQSGSTTAMQNNLWDSATSPQSTTSNNNLFDAQGIWGGAGNTGNTNGVQSSGNGLSLTTPTQKKDDAFSDIWGGFK